MEWSKLKNIILIILLITNLFLLGLVGLQEWNASRHRIQAREDALKVVERSGIRMKEEALPEDRLLPVATVERDRGEEAKLLTPLLGEVTETALGGGQYFYTGEKGEAYLRNRGDFTVSLPSGAYPLEGEMREHAVNTLSLMGFQGVVADCVGDGEAGKVTLVQMWNQVEVHTCQVTALYEGGSLVSITGNRINGTPVSGGGVELSAVTGLLRFLEKFGDTGDVCSEVLAMRAGYQLSASLSDSSVLVPVWYVLTDTGSYLLDMTGNQLRKL